jgi:hypothetical protein
MVWSTTAFGMSDQPIFIVVFDKGVAAKTIHKYVQKTCQLRLACGAQYNIAG